VCCHSVVKDTACCAVGVGQSFLRDRDLFEVSLEFSKLGMILHAYIICDVLLEFFLNQVLNIMLTTTGCRREPTCILSVTEYDNTVLILLFVITTVKSGCEAPWDVLLRSDL